MTAYWQIAALLISIITVMVGQSDNGSGTIMLVGFVGWVAAMAWVFIAGVGA